LSLREETLEALQTLGESLFKNYEDLIQHLEMRFGNKHLEQVYEAQLSSRTQRSQETLQQYEAGIARLVYLAYPTASQDVREPRAVHAFVRVL